MQLEAKILPENASYKTVTWTSSDPNKVQIDNSGFARLFGDKFDDVTITVTTDIILTVSSLFIFLSFISFSITYYR
ncbi:MAG: Ig-like domain-containing protein [Treponema sp.]|nr:Ig-like domain-containing protein [Treponema sp.]